MARNNVDETRAVAHLPNLDIEIIHRRPSDGNAEQMVITLRAMPSFEVFGGYLEAANPMLFWMKLTQMVWSPWLGSLAAASKAMKSLPRARE
jgi:hypothetical protein